MECLIINVSDDDYMCAGDFSLKPEFGEQEFIKPESVSNPFIENEPPRIKNEFIFGGFALPPSSSSVEDYVESSGNELEDEVVIISDDEDAPPDTPLTDGISSIVISNVETIVECPSSLLIDSIGEAAKPEATLSVSHTTLGLHAVREERTSGSSSISNDSSKELENLKLSNQDSLPIPRCTLDLHSASGEGTSTSNDASKELESHNLPKQVKVFFKCKICEFSANTRFSLVRHQMRRNHDEKRNDAKVKNQVEYDQNRTISSLPGSNKNTTVPPSQKNCTNNGAPLIPGKNSLVSLSPLGNEVKQTVNALQNKKTSLLVKKSGDILGSQKKSFIKNVEKSTQLNRKHPLRSKKGTSSSDKKENANQIVKPIQKNRRAQLRLKNVEVSLSSQGGNNGENIVKSTQDNETRLLHYKNVDGAPSSQEKNNEDIPVKCTNTSRILLCRKNMVDVPSQVKNDQKYTFIEKSNILKSAMIGSNEHIPKLKVFNCKLCSFSCKIRFALKRHMLAHAQKRETRNSFKFKCIYCSFERDSKKALFYHMLNAHKANNTKCTVCRKNVPDYFKKDHLIRCQKSKPTLKCDQCHYETLDRRKLIWHGRKCGQEFMKAKLESTCKRKIVKDETSAENRLFCKFCSFSTSAARTLKLHTNLHTVHNRPILQCKICDYRSTKHNLWSHMRTCHRTNLGPKLSKVHEGKRLKNKLVHELGAVKSNIGAKFNCNFCSFKTNSSSYLTNHLRSHTVYNRPIHSCQECDFKSTLRVLLVHVKTAHLKKLSVKGADEANMSCNFCSYTCNTSRSLKMHIRAHTVHNITIRKCSECNFKSTSRVLLNHVRVAHGHTTQQSVFPCHFCSFSATSDRNIRNHIKLHTVFKETIYQCDKCDYKSTRRNLTLHLKNNHGLDGNIKSVPEIISFPSKTNEDSFKFDKKYLGRPILDKNSNEHLVGVQPIEKDEPDSSNKIEIVQTFLNQNKGVSGDFATSNILFVCEICDYVTKRKEVLISHKLIHSGVTINTKETKPVLKTDVKTKKTLRLDKDVSEQKSAIICPVCKRHLSRNQGLKSHVCAKNTDQYSVQVNERIVMYQCKRCSYRTGLKQNMLRHCNYVKHPMKALYKCSFCRFQANCKAKLNLHRRMRHSAILGAKQESNQRALKKHKSNYYNIDKDVSEQESVIICPVCNRHLSGNQGLKSHVCVKNTDQYSVHVNGRIVMYQCKRCSYRTGAKESMLRHCDYVKHSMEVLYKCSFCRFQANCKAKLNQHRRMRHGGILGEKQESNQWASEKHKSDYYSIGQERENTTGAMYKCDTCDFQTNFEDNLHNHQILHININEVRVYKNKTYNVGSEK